MVLTTIIFSLQPSIVLVVHDSPTPPARLAQQDDSSTVFVWTSAIRIRLFQRSDANLDYLQRDGCFARNGLGRHVYDALLVSENNELLEGD